MNHFYTDNNDYWTEVPIIYARDKKHSQELEEKYNTFVDEKGEERKRQCKIVVDKRVFERIE